MLILHIGMGRSGTTWMQKYLFPYCLTHNYLGKYQNSFPEEIMKFNYLDDFEFSNWYKKKGFSWINSIQTSNNIISSEAFTNLGSLESQLNRVSKFFSNANILFVVRNPIEWVISNYNYCVFNEEYFRPLSEYLDFEGRRMPFTIEKRKRFYLPSLFYNDIFNFIKSNFSESQYIFYKYEDFCSDKLSFLKLLNEKWGLKFDNNAVKLNFDNFINNSRSIKELNRKREENFKKFYSSVFKNKFEESDICLKEPYKDEDLIDLRNFFKKKVNFFYNL